MSSEVNAGVISGLVAAGPYRKVAVLQKPSGKVWHIARRSTIDRDGFVSCQRSRTPLRPRMVHLMDLDWSKLCARCFRGRAYWSYNMLSFLDTYQPERSDVFKTNRSFTDVAVWFRRAVERLETLRRARDEPESVSEADLEFATKDVDSLGSDMVELIALPDVDCQMRSDMRSVFARLVSDVFEIAPEPVEVELLSPHEFAAQAVALAQWNTLRRKLAWCSHDDLPVADWLVKIVEASDRQSALAEVVEAVAPELAAAVSLSSIPVSELPALVAPVDTGTSVEEVLREQTRQFVLENLPDVIAQLLDLMDEVLAGDIRTVMFVTDEEFVEFPAIDEVSATWNAVLDTFGTGEVSPGSSELLWKVVTGPAYVVEWVARVAASRAVRVRTELEVAVWYPTVHRVGLNAAVHDSYGKYAFHYSDCMLVFDRVMSVAAIEAFGSLLTSGALLGDAYAAASALAAS